MSKKKNRGFSMVEILVAITIFAILMIPIVTTITNSIRGTTNAKSLQYRNEFAENLMEYVKEDSIESILAKGYLVDNGSYDVNVVSKEDTIAATSPTGKDSKYVTYDITGKVRLGTKHEEYSYALRISNKQYAEQNAAGTYEDPNNATFGVVENLDYTKVALIDGTMANFDQTAENNILAKKLALLKEKDSDAYEQYVKNVNAGTSSSYTNRFSDDRANRYITVKVSQEDYKETDGSNHIKYTVSCSLKYVDDSDPLLGEVIDVQPVYGTSFIDKLPNIYMMYNVCVYNEFYSPDCIIFDTDDLSKDTDVNVFIIETAEDYSSSLKATASGASSVPNGESSVPSTGGSSPLYREADNSISRNDITIYMAATTNTQLNKLHIYHNFDYNLATPNTDYNKKNEKLSYKSLSGSGLSTSDYKPLIKMKGLLGNTVDKANSAEVGALNTATQGQRGLYLIELWISKGSTVDTSRKATLTGTKGVDETNSGNGLSVNVPESSSSASGTP
ncbi:MAG: prepilin-type N-terminal cleavage/methylation domain-containing protein [Lachnospiraceae bacterium]